MIDDLKPYPEYKESGLPWVGQIPQHWLSERAKRLFKKMDRQVNESDEVVTCFRDGTVTLRKNRRLRGYTEAIYELGYQGVRKGDLVIHAMDAFAGAVGVSDSDGKATPVYSVCRPRDDSNAFYYAYVVREMARTLWIVSLSRGIRERSTDFRFDAFGSQEVPIPPPDEQAAIVRFLGHLNRRVDQAIRSKRKLIALLNEQKQAIIHKAVTRGLDPNVPLKDSGIPWLGQIPAHWETPLNQRLFKEEVRKSNPQLDTPLSLSQRDGLIASEHLQERSLQTSSYSNWKKVLPGDLVANRFKAHLGVFFASNLTGMVSFHYGVFKPAKPMVTKYFELLYHCNVYRAIYAGRSNGMTVGLQNLSNQNFYNVRSIVPPPTEQEAILAFLETATSGEDKEILRLKEEVDLLREYRTRLVSDVVTGKLDVRAAAAKLPPEVEESDSVAESEDLDELDDEVVEEAA